jgi:zinc protease
MRRPDDRQDHLAKKYRELRLDPVDAAARRAIGPDRFIRVVVGDASKVRPRLDSLGLPVEVVPAADVAAAPKPIAQ